MAKNILATLMAGSFSLAIAACSTSTDKVSTSASLEKAVPTVDVVLPEGLAASIEARDEKDKARDKWRNPGETLAFFGITADMSVVETLPGGGWYSRILIPFLDEKGTYGAASYPYAMFPKILSNPTDEFLAQAKVWPETFPGQAASWGATGEVRAFEFGKAPEVMFDSVDAVLMIRALHNFNRAGGDFGEEALGDIYAVLKPGGILGIVQHRVKAGDDGVPTDGTNGYMSEQAIIDMVTAEGFVFEAKAEMNANPADMPGKSDVVWRLPPSLACGEKDRAKHEAIGETDRVTMRFRKPIG